MRALDIGFLSMFYASLSSLLDSEILMISMTTTLDMEENIRVLESPFIRMRDLRIGFVAARNHRQY